MQPDEDTKNRIKNLAIVGKALYAATSDTTGSTDFYLAKTALIDFSVGIHRLDLDTESMKGMDDLINFLDNKIDENMDKIDS